MLKKTMVLMLLVLFSVNMSGCAPLLLAGGAIAGGVGTATWISGKLAQELDASFERTIQAAESALASFGLDIVSKTKKEEVAQIKSKYTDGKTIWIDINKLSRLTSRVAVRVGAIPDKDATRRILDRIKEYLKEQFESTTEKKFESTAEKGPEVIIVEENLK